MTLAQRLGWAVREKCLCTVSQVLAEGLLTPRSLDVNKPTPPDGRTVLHTASYHGASDIVALLLAYPGIDVNILTWHGNTALDLASLAGEGSVVRVLLSSRKVNLQHRNPRGATAVSHCARRGHLDILLMLLADERLVFDSEPAFYADVGEQCSLSEVALKYHNPEAASVFERFEADPAAARFSLRVELNWERERAAVILAMVVLLCDSSI